VLLLGFLFVFFIFYFLFFIFLLLLLLLFPSYFYNSFCLWVLVSLDYVILSHDGDLFLEFLFQLL
jgi:hypothetical protein